MAPERSTESDMSTQPLETLQLRALEQRSQLHRSASDLRERVNRTKDQLSLPKQARKHLVAISTIAILAGFVMGYGVAGIFTGD
jgi:hypothetical protein